MRLTRTLEAHSMVFPNSLVSQAEVFVSEPRYELQKC